MMAMLRPIAPCRLGRNGHFMPTRLLYHTSAPWTYQATRGGKGSSRTRLTDSMKFKPGFRSANLEVAHKARGPKQSFSRESMHGRHAPFKREGLPHTDPGFVPLKRQERNVSSGGKNRSASDREGGRGRWETERRSAGGRLTKSHAGMSTDRSKFRDHRPPVRIQEVNKRDRPSPTGSNTSRLLQHSNTTSPKIRNEIPLDSDFSESRTVSQDPSQLQMRFTSPPLMPGLLKCLKETLGPSAMPTPIQALSLKWLLNDASEIAPQSGWNQFLLASETGSGKSLAYLLPLLQSLKQAELNPSPLSPLQNSSHVSPVRPLNPRALVLAPTHELARQLSGSAKSLLHEVKLRVLCASRANVKNMKERDATARQMVAQLDRATGSGIGEFDVNRSGFPVDLVVGTPMKLLEMVRGRGWDRRELQNEEGYDSEAANRLRRGRDKMFGVGQWKSKPEMGLANVEWVIVDEADVLFDPDFQETTRQLLADVSEARGHPVTFSSSSSLSLTKPSPSAAPSAPTTGPIEYPFNFILTSATIPSALANYLDTHHPKLMRLASPRLHHLPKGLQTEYVNWTGGNKYADIERRIRHVWADDAISPGTEGAQVSLSKMLIFCNKSSKVDDLGKYLEEKGIKNVALSSTSTQRKRGSNRHLDGFLKVREASAEESERDVDGAVAPSASPADPKSTPHVMITTSLLSRGLDFSPSIQHVFIVDEPRNMIDFLHRAGRTGRAGQKGKVVVFGKLKGRGSAKAQDVRKRVGSLISRR